MTSPRRYDTYRVRISRDDAHDQVERAHNLTDVVVEMGGNFRTFGPPFLAEQHANEDAPLEWCNWVGIELDREHDAVVVSVSTGDPRGAFQFMVARHRYHDDENDRDVDELRMKAPHPDDAAPHQGLTPLNPRNYYRIGGTT